MRPIIGPERQRQRAETAPGCDSLQARFSSSAAAIFCVR